MKNAFTNATTTLSATIIKADGTRIPLGIICQSKPENRLVRFMKKIFGGRK